MVKGAVFLFFYIFFPFFAFAGVTQNVSCPPASSTVSEVLITYDYKSSVNITIASNYYSMVLPETPSGLYVYNMKIKALSTVSGLIPLTNSANVVIPTSCVAVVDLDYQSVSENLLMGLAGVTCGGLFVYALLKNS